MIVTTDWLADLRCAGCGGEAVMTVAPGSEPETGPGKILLERGVVVSGWCLACAIRLGWLAAPDQAEARACITR